MRIAFYRFVFAVLRPVYTVLFPAREDGLENVPAEGGFILCCNHMRARDPFYLAVHARTRHIHFMAKAELFRYRLIGAFVRALGGFPVDRGHSDLNAVRTSLDILKEGHGLGVFPQGTRSPDNTPTPMLDGVSMIALRSGVPVIPAYIGGPYRLFHRMQVSFGPPVSFEGLGRRVDSATLDQATRRIEAAVWGLKR